MSHIFAEEIEKSAAVSSPAIPTLSSQTLSSVDVSIFLYNLYLFIACIVFIITSK